MVPVEELLWEEEGTTLDFKQNQYKFSLANNYEKSELLKDIIAFANAWRREDAYILIGVKDIKGGRGEVLGITEELDDAQIQQFVNSKTQKPISFSYQVLGFDNLKIAIIKIPVQKRPVYLTKDYGKLKRGVVYLRRGSSTSEATPDEVFKMGEFASQSVSDTPYLSFEFANKKNRASLGKSLEVKPTILDVPPADEIPDFEEVQSGGRFHLQTLSTTVARKNYFRELVNYYFIRQASTELNFLIKNNSNKTLTDIRVELNINTNAENIKFYTASEIPEMPNSHYDYMSPISNFNSVNIPPLRQRPIEIHNLPKGLCVEIPFEKAQPKQTIFSFEPIFILIRESCSFQIDITIFSDDLAEPAKQSLLIKCEANRVDGSFEKIREIYKKELIAKLNRDKR